MPTDFSDDRTGRETQLRGLERRDSHLWWMAIVVVLSLTLALLFIHAPDLLGGKTTGSAERRVYLLGLSAMILCFCAYVVQSAHTLKKLRWRLSTTESENTQIQTLLATVERQAGQLRASERRYRSLLQNSLDTVMMVSPDGLIEFVNHAGEMLFGKKAAELLGQELGHPIEENETTEIRIVGADGRRKVGEVRAVEAAWHAPHAMLVSIRDVTARKKAEQTLSQANEQLRKVDQMRSELVSTISHELRTPMTSIKNAVHLIVSEKAGPISDDQKRFLDMAARNIDRLTEIVSALLDLAKIRAGRLSFHFSEVSLRSAIENTIATFEPQADSNSLRLEFNCPEFLPSVCADQTRMEQILCNLLSNAVKFTPAGGRIVVSAHPVDQEVELSVADTGIGMDATDRDRIFEPFYQTTEATRVASKGTGLGLAITKELVEVHGGRLSVESEVGVGTRFFFRLPVFSEQALELVEFEMGMKDWREMSLFSLLLVEFEGADGEAGEEARRTARDLREPLRRLLPDESDVIAMQPAFHRLVILLAGTSRAGADLVRDKIAGRMMRAEPFLKPGVQLRLCGPATYPHDGATGRGLIEAAQGLRAKRRDCT